MNDVLRTLFNHKSDRQFTDETIDDAALDNIITAAYHAPTSINSQQVSVIVVRDQERRAHLAQLCGNQPWVAKAPVFLVFVFDMHKTELGMAQVEVKQQAHESIEAIVSGATDVGIALSSSLVAAHSLGLGGVPIGGIRLHPQQVTEYLNLPQHTFAVAGLAIGHIEQHAHVKPRLPMATFRHEERYQEANMVEHIQQYNQQLLEHWQNIGRSEGEDWSHSIANYYQRVYYPDVAPTLKKQGFTNKF